MTAFEEAFTKFMEAAQAICDREHAVTNPGYTKLSHEKGRRYIRIVATHGGQRSAWAFVDITNGDVLKSDGWKGPARGARGNIYDDRNGCGRARWTQVH